MTVLVVVPTLVYAKVSKLSFSVHFWTAWCPCCTAVVLGLSESHRGAERRKAENGYLTLLVLAGGILADPRQNLS